MNAKLRFGAFEETFPLPENIFMAGLLYPPYTANDLCDLLFDGVICHRTEKRLPDGTELAILCYVSGDPYFHTVMERFQGLELLYFSRGGLTLTVTA